MIEGGGGRGRGGWGQGGRGGGEGGAGRVIGRVGGTVVLVATHTCVFLKESCENLDDDDYVF